MREGIQEAGGSDRELLQAKMGEKHTIWKAVWHFHQHSCWVPFTHGFTAHTQSLFIVFISLKTMTFGKKTESQKKIHSQDRTNGAGFIVSSLSSMCWKKKQPYPEGVSKGRKFHCINLWSPWDDISYDLGEISYNLVYQVRIPGTG
jgi:hypothetical protein